VQVPDDPVTVTGSDLQSIATGRKLGKAEGSDEPEVRKPANQWGVLLRRKGAVNQE